MPSLRHPGSFGPALRLALAGAILWFASATASAQAPANDPNPGALTFSGGLDVPSVYFFRGIRQETDPKLTLFPYGDIAVALSSSATVNFGVWNSLQTGSSGTGGNRKLQYEEDFYTALNLGLGGGLGFGTTFTAYTSPNGLFTTTKEIMFKVSKAQMLAPYGIVAFEIGGETSGQADSGQAFGGGKGTYVELGVGPSWPLGGGKATLAIPAKIGLSLKDYYETTDGVTVTDHKFGFFDIGALVTVPLSGGASRFGAWNVHVGGDALVLGADGAFNVNSKGESKKNQFIFLFGLGVGY